MSDERKYSDKFLDNLFAGHKISKDEYLYIIRKEV